MIDYASDSRRGKIFFYPIAILPTVWYNENSSPKYETYEVYYAERNS